MPKSERKHEEDRESVKREEATEKGKQCLHVPAHGPAHLTTNCRGQMSRGLRPRRLAGNVLKVTRRVEATHWQGDLSRRNSQQQISGHLY